MKTNLKRILALMAVLCMVLSAWGGVVAEKVYEENDGHTHVYTEITYEDPDGKAEPATCTADGVARTVCVLCGKLGEYVNVPAHGHAFDYDHPFYNEWIYQPATCEVEGAKWEWVEAGCYYCDARDLMEEHHVSIPATGHKWPKDEDAEPDYDNTDTYVPATCTSDGSVDMVVYCENGCGTKKVVDKKVIPAHEHTEGDPVDENVVEATCKTQKKTWDEVTYCTECGAELKREAKEEKADPEVAHTPDKAKKENVKPATCYTVEEWDDVVYCKVCGEKLSSEHKTGDTVKHDWAPDTGNPKNVAATCFTDGVEWQYCTKCGTKEEVKDQNPKTIKATGEHVYGDPITIPATCISAGSKQQICQNKAIVDGEEVVCGHVNILEKYDIDPNAHKWVDVEERSREATCTKKGVKAEECELCGARRATEIPAKGHTVKVLEAIPATCEEAGWTAGTYCEDENCDATPVQIKDFTYTDPTTGREVTVSYPGTVDGVLLTAPTGIAPTGHKVLRILQDVNEETICTEDGERYCQCAICGEKYWQYVKAMGHDFVLRNPEGDVPNSCVVTGYNVFVCTRCGQEKREYVEATGEHKFSEEITELPTCKKAGRIYQVCEICGFENELTFLPIDPEAHEWEQADWNEWNVKQYPSCTEDGIGKYYCLICGAEKYDVYPAYGHDPVKVPGYAPTCEDEGATAGTICGNCGEWLEEPEEIPATGHKFKQVGETEATCVKKGTVNYVCEVCGEEKKVENVLGDHTLIRWTALDKAPSCVSGGAEAYVCYYCDYVEYKTTGKVDPTAHTWVKLEQISVPTCVYGAFDLYACYYCDARIVKESETSKADPNNHVWCDVGDHMACYYCDAVKAK